MEIKTIRAPELYRKMRESNLFLVDLRSPEEYRQEHLPGARNCPYEYMEQWKRSLPRKRKIVLICEHGNLSMKAARILDQEGVEAYSLIGGMHAWKDWKIH